MIAIVGTKRHELAMRYPHSGATAPQAKAIGRVVDDRPLIDWIADQRLYGGCLIQIDTFTEGKQLIKLTARESCRRIRLREVLAGGTKVDRLEAYCDLG